MEECWGEASQREQFLLKHILVLHWAEVVTVEHGQQPPSETILVVGDAPAVQLLVALLVQAAAGEARLFVWCEQAMVVGLVEFI